MALRTPLSVTPHLYMGDSTGRPLDMGTVYFGEQDKDPEFYPITLYSDDALTLPLAQPVHTKGGYLYDKGDMVEPHAKEIIYSVKVLDSYGRKVFYKGAMMRNSWNDDVIEQINTAIIGSADVARQVAIDITNDAINNTAVEGGVLADTFVTVTSNAAGSIPRNLRSKNSDRQYLTDFGDFGDDGDWTSAFHAAAATGKTTWIPDGNYKLRTEAFDCQGKDLIFKSDNAVVTLFYGVGTAAFDITDCNKVEMTGVTFQIDEGLLLLQRRLFVCSPTSLVGELNVSHCKFRNNIVLIRTNGATTQNPEITPYGFKRFIFNDNRLDNINHIFTQLRDYPIYHGEIKRNTVNNFSGVLMNFGGTVGEVIGTAILDITKFFIEDNIVTTDDDFWNNDAASGYHCFALVEGSQATWLRNNISGMKTKSESVSIYDAYLSVQTLTSEGNTYKNIANFNPAYGKLTHLMKAKKRSTAERPCVKVVKNNKYIIEDEWLRRIDETECSHMLFGLGDGNGGDVTVTDNYISIHTLQNQGNSVFDKLFFINNTVRAKKLISSSAPNGSFRFLEVRPFDYRGELAVIDNKFYIEDMQTNIGVVSFINNESIDNPTWDRLTVLRNTLDAAVGSNAGVRFIDKVRSLNTKISGNICATNTHGLFVNSELGNVTGTGNTANRTLGTYSPILRTTIYGSGVIEQSGVGRISGMSLTVPLDPNMSYTQYVVSVEIITVTGSQTIEFNYQLQVIDGIPKIKFRTPTNSLRTVTINSTEETGTEIKSVLTGVDTPKLSAKLLNTLTNTEVVIEGLPTIPVPFKVSFSAY